MVLSHALAHRLTGLKPEEAVGATVRVRERDRRLVGVLAPVEGEQVGAAYIPIQGVGDALAPTPKPRAPTLVLRARTIEDVTPVQAGAERWLASRYGAEWKKVARVETNRKQLQDVEQGMILFRLFMGAITGISLLVGGIGIMNVLLASVNGAYPRDRRPEGGRCEPLGHPGAVFPRGVGHDLRAGQRAGSPGREALTARFEQERAAIRKILAQCPSEKRGEQVLIPRLRGLEDSSRFWSAWMTLEHLRITNTVLAMVIKSLAHGRVPAKKASTADVKPRADLTVDVEAA